MECCRWHWAYWQRGRNHIHSRVSHASRSTDRAYSKQRPLHRLLACNQSGRHVQGHSNCRERGLTPEPDKHGASVPPERQLSSAGRPRRVLVDDSLPPPKDRRVYDKPAVLQTGHATTVAGGLAASHEGRSIVSHTDLLTLTRPANWRRRWAASKAFKAGEDTISPSVGTLARRVRLARPAALRLRPSVWFWFAPTELSRCNASTEGSRHCPGSASHASGQDR